ncbi:unnamed protein product [Didymodactylos carnosus]|uniref:Uncharacterized protein n=1 Tax=Didymodactylos carnosus TaxID=1234261 RepID=A0A8S2F1B5_9BILA|nr:unnamed protein product [Didymodactylos carnosus]CAF4123681.1 unnamed protein product [Didymodactylos carnosus]
MYWETLSVLNELFEFVTVERPLKHISVCGNIEGVNISELLSPKYLISIYLESISYGALGDILPVLSQVKQINIGLLSVDRMWCYLKLPLESATVCSLKFDKIGSDINLTQIRSRLEQLPNLQKLFFTEIENQTLVDGDQWKSILRASNIQKFYFHFVDKQKSIKLDRHLKEILPRFQSDFWLKEKQASIKAVGGCVRRGKHSEFNLTVKF